MRRLVVFYGIALAAAVPALAAGGSPWSWALPEIRIVVAHRLMAPSVASCRPDDPLTRGDLSDLEEGLTGTVPPPLGEPDAPATMAQLDAGLVKALGLAVPARRFLLAARTAGLAPPARFGNEVVARMLALRFNHP